jgi:hypothetical protein
MRVGPSAVEVDAGSSPTVLVDGRRIVLGSQVRRLGGGGSVSLDRAGEVVVTWPDGSKADIVTDQLGEDVIFSAPHDLVRSLSGLLTADVTSAKTPNDDETLVGGNGKRFTLDPNTKRGFATLYEGFAPTWRISQRSSLFTYARGKNAQSYIVKNFPSRIATDQSIFGDAFGRLLGNLQILRDKCEAAGITNHALLDDCIIDGYETGLRDLGLVTKATAEVGETLRDLQRSTASTASTAPPRTASGSGSKVSPATVVADPCALLTLRQADLATGFDFARSQVVSRPGQYAGSCQFGLEQAAAFTLWVEPGTPQQLASAGAQRVIRVDKLGHDATWTQLHGPSWGELYFNLGSVDKTEYTVGVAVTNGGISRATAIASDCLSNL